MQTPFAARIQEPVDRQRLQNVFPIRALPTGRQQRPPEFVRFQFLPQLATDPTRSPLPRPVQRELIQPHAHPTGDMSGNHLPRRIQRQLSTLLRGRVENLDGLGPGRLLTVVDFAQIENRPLHPFARRRTHLLSDAPIAMIFAVLESMMTMQKGLAPGSQITACSACPEGTRSAPNLISTQEMQYS